MESARERKIREAKEFFSRIRIENALFIGISGSVSYEPREEDDIDIFLIAKNNRLWTSIMEILIFRRIYRFEPLCLSLCMDDSYALPFFLKLKEGLAAKDSKMVVPIFGGNYFRKLLKASPVISGGVEGENIQFDLKPSKSSAFQKIADCIPFLIVASWVNIKAIYSNHKNRKEGKGGFKTVFSLHNFYFDTDKYHRLNDKYLRGEVLNEENCSDI